MANTQDSNTSFIKEFEELKLKQKILIESLRNKRIDKYESLLTEIQTKLDFLTKMFTDTEASSGDEEEDAMTQLKEKIEGIGNQVEDIQNSINLNFKSVNSRLTVLEEGLDSLKDLKDKSKSLSLSQGTDGLNSQGLKEGKGGDLVKSQDSMLDNNQEDKKDDKSKKKKWF